MSTRRRLGLKQNADRADRRSVLVETHVCQTCRRQYAKGTPAATLERHLATHGKGPA